MIDGVSKTAILTLRGRADEHPSKRRDISGSDGGRLA